MCYWECDGVLCKKLCYGAVKEAVTLICRPWGLEEVMPVCCEGHFDGML